MTNIGLVDHRQQDCVCHFPVHFFDKKPGTSIFSTQNDDPPKSNFFKAPDENYLSNMFEKAKISPKKDDEKTLSSSFDKAKK